MAITFPASPTNGQKFNSGTVTYTYSTATGAWAAGPRGTAEPFNYFINPSFQCSQQNANTAGTATSYFPADNWNQEFVGAMVPTIQRVQVKTPFGSTDRLRVTVTTADAALTTTDHWQLYTRLDGTRVAPLGWMGGLKKPIVVRFGFKGPAGTYGMAITNGAFNYIYVASFTITAGQANTDTIQTFAVPVPPAGTWVSYVTTTVGMQFCIWLASGPTYVGVAGWNNAALYVAPGLSNGMGVAAAVFEMFDFGMYRDPNSTGRAPPWQATPEADAMLASQRHWYKCMAAGGGTSAITTITRGGFNHPTRMRAAPAIAQVGAPNIYDGTANGALSAPSSAMNDHYAEFSGTTGTLTINRAVTMNGTASAYLGLSARM